MHEIVTTVGPSSLDVETLTQMFYAGATDFRINLSHSSPESLTSYLDVLKGASVPFSLDTQGAQLRIEKIIGTNFLEEGSELNIFSVASDYDSPGIGINHSEFFTQIEVGDTLKIDFGGVVVSILNVDVSNCLARAKVLKSGNIVLNRAVDIQEKTIHLSYLTEFDEYAIGKFAASGLKSIYLSFASSRRDIQRLNALLDSCCLDEQLRPRIIAKIESRMGLLNLRDIASSVDGILIDRGDLSREISISRIPLATKAILEVCQNLSTPCYVATNILDSMMTSDLPSRAEISDLFNLFVSGSSGIVLAAEAAIGKNPVSSVQVVKHMSRVYESSADGTIGFITGKMLNSSLADPLLSWL
ncbi:MAG: hypothetical protein CL831_10720 [Crocinitomicaceae bacterium]|nr:hypothetical protein [Crocinitomicaceae bacterium]